MAYGLSNGHVTDDVTLPQNVLWGSTVGYPSDSLASCYLCHAIINAVIAVCPFVRLSRSGNCRRNSFHHL